MVLNMKSLKICVELYGDHVAKDYDYLEAKLTLDKINDILIEKISKQMPEMLMAQMKDKRIRELKEQLQTKPLETVLGDLLEEGSFPLNQECEQYMAEQLASADLVYLP